MVMSDSGPLSYSDSIGTYRSYRDYMKSIQIIYWDPISSYLSLSWLSLVQFIYSFFHHIFLDLPINPFIQPPIDLDCCGVLQSVNQSTSLVVFDDPPFPLLPSKSRAQSSKQLRISSFDEHALHHILGHKFTNRLFIIHIRSPISTVCLSM